jgi:hypothetical protein
MNEVVQIVALVIATPFVVAGTVALFFGVRGWYLKAREMAIKEQQVRAEAETRRARLDAETLQSFDTDMILRDLESIRKSIEALKQRVERLEVGGSVDRSQALTPEPTGRDCERAMGEEG